jgi:hypothetical protein
VAPITSQGAAGEGSISHPQSPSVAAASSAVRPPVLLSDEVRAFLCVCVSARVLHMYACVYIHMYTYTYTPTHPHTHTHTHTHIIHTHTHVSVCVYDCVCVSVYTYMWGAKASMCASFPPKKRLLLARAVCRLCTSQVVHKLQKARAKTKNLGGGGDVRGGREMWLSHFTCISSDGRKWPSGYFFMHVNRLKRPSAMLVGEKNPGKVHHVARSPQCDRRPCALLSRPSCRLRSRYPRSQS